MRDTSPSSACWIVNGRLDMTPNPNPEAVEQLRLRHQLTAHACDLYAHARFTVVAQDVILGPHLQFMIDELQFRPLHVVVLTPGPDVVTARERRRPKTSYERWTIELLDRGLRQDTTSPGSS